jgi:tRNA nucleotidyltransferase (CCA-adding enzyme)
VTLEEDLARRDLTINAMARDAEGGLIDPFGGEADLRAGVLRHVSPAFVEDPLRVLRVARFAARFGFAVAPETAKLMRKLVASGELAELAAERVWQELSRGLMERHPSRMLAVLHDCGALAQLLPELDARLGALRRASSKRKADLGVHVAVALDHAAARGFALPVRYAVLVLDPGTVPSPLAAPTRTAMHVVDGVRIAEQVSRRLRAPAECRDAARLAARWRTRVETAHELPPAKLLDLVTAADALRRPERLETLLQACECMALPGDGAVGEYPPSRIVHAALGVIRSVDAGAVARRVRPQARTGAAGRADAVGKAVRAARLRALRDWRRAGRATP